MRFYCERCDACVCVMCTFNEHRDHDIMQFSEAVVKYKDHIAALMTRCKDKIQQFDAQIDSLNQCDDVMRSVRPYRAPHAHTPAPAASRTKL